MSAFPSSRDRLLTRLADGRFHSGQALAADLGVSRAAIWKQVRALQAHYGVKIDAVRGRGYRLAGAMELLNEQTIREQLSQSAIRDLEEIRLLVTTDSTNERALGDLPAQTGRAKVWLAEHQTGGRGRRGREWVSTFGRNIYLSLAWRFDLPMAKLTGLSLAAGVAVAESLHARGMRGHTLKWPNDVLVDGSKLCGILLEVSGEADGPASAVIGIGLNFYLPSEVGGKIDQAWTDLQRSCPVSISRNVLAGTIIDRVLSACRDFSIDGLPSFADRWRDFDPLLGQRVRIVHGRLRVEEGIYRGIAPSGAMVLEGPDGLSEHHAGEISLRPTGEP